jgi:hypothetical protein
MVGKRYYDLLALTEAYGIEDGKITEKALSVEASKVAACDDVPAIS